MAALVAVDDFRLPKGEGAFQSSILRTLTDEKYEAAIVGGAVRDILSGLTTTDFDVATSAHPDAIIDLAKRNDWPLVDKLGTLLSVLQFGISLAAMVPYHQYD